MYINYNKLTDWTPAKVLSQLETSDKWVESAIVALYQRQTEIEKQAGCTVDDNERGLQQADAKDFGRLARKILAGGHLTIAELAHVRRPWRRGSVPVITIGKYRKQLVRMIEAKAAQKLQMERVA